ncbi:YggN family protein [Alishewanella sp. 16-MA]|uniref:YggN family protein n=1 Tax=Alishewanella maricola TaxID=2795740 RepID=A0ABS8C0C6_9ALTE|nr:MULTISPECIES: DUF2884 family protein [Gammaproteobacteria]MDP4945219.1 YggN family protein [Alishewanella sp.]MCB5225769.1 YggN family protein [Alishewanella maricola]MCC5450977.1 YggN family protein [Rheinheimera sp. UJ51]MCF4007956.1 YggN family protein [Rheinheimera sp. UJ63]MDP5037083.1 YggN family protein [Alishewanella sp.]
MAFRYGVLISPEHIRMMQNNRTHVQINHDQQLFVRGELQTLSEEEQRLLQQYAEGLRKFVPEIVSLAVDGVEVGLSSIEAMLAGVGSQSQQDEWRALIRETTFQFLSRFVRSGDHFYLAPQSLNELDNFLNRELKPQLTSLARRTVGAVWGALRDALRQSDNNFERAETQDWQSVNQLMEKITLGMDEKMVELEAKSALFCQRMRELDHIESKLQKRIASLAQFDVVVEKPE